MADRPIVSIEKDGMNMLHYNTDEYVYKMEIENSLAPVDCKDILFGIPDPLFGLLVPNDNGPMWGHQIDGVSCHRIHIRGIYLPLRVPKKSFIKYDFTYGFPKDRQLQYYDWRQSRGIHLYMNLLDILMKVNYNYVDSTLIWKYINEELPFEYELVYPYSEGVRVIKITSVKDFPENESEKDYKNDLRPLIGKEIYLIYPNSD